MELKQVTMRLLQTKDAFYRILSFMTLEELTADFLPKLCKHTRNNILKTKHFWRHVFFLWRHEFSLRPVQFRSDLDSDRNNFTAPFVTVQNIKFIDRLLSSSDDFPKILLQLSKLQKRVG